MKFDGVILFNKINYDYFIDIRGKYGHMNGIFPLVMLERYFTIPTFSKCNFENHIW